MDLYSSGEELFIKTRKPYTITKQRERWTQEEHNRFLEALKLYGRAWQRIEEHIGTKTAVQIRSHAQKFFTKLEKEALVKGVPIGQALDIEIPPPRPKRKPSNPYPRKTSVGTPTSQVSAKDGQPLTSVSCLPTGKLTLDLEKEPPPEKHNGDEKLEKMKKNQEKDNCSEVFSLSQDAPCTSQSSANKSSMPIVAPRNICPYRELVPILKEVINQDETNESFVTVESKGNQQLHKLDVTQKIVDNGTCNTSNLGNSHPSPEKLIQGIKLDELTQSENYCTLLANDMQASQNCPRHVPVHVLDGSLGISNQTVSPDILYQESMFYQMGQVHEHTQFANLAASATTEQHDNPARSFTHQSLRTFHPLFTPIGSNQDDCRSFLHISSTFSSLIVAALLQNPATHAAASFAATFLPWANVEGSADSPAGSIGDFPSRQMNSAPSMAAIAAATVAAATAWWASHGMLPLCTPFNTGFACTPVSTTATSMDNSKVGATNNKGTENTSDLAKQDPQLDPKYSEALQEEHSPSKLMTSSLTDSAESKDRKPNAGSTAADPEQAAAVNEPHDSNKIKSRKPVDRSSCGSNTPSSSEVETDALENHEKGEEESKEPDASHPACDSSNRRGKISSNPNDSWKEVSEGGRLAFQALFSREVLPQSFSPPHDLNKGQQKSNIGKDVQNADQKDEVLQLDRNGKTCGSCSSYQSVENNLLLRGEYIGEVGLLTMGLGHGKLRPHRTGFKPYKRCSVEAKESRIASTTTQDEEKGPKRMRLEGGASA